MLPLVLGGIALATVGYKVLEDGDQEGCPWDEKESSSSSRLRTHIFEELQKQKVDLVNDKLLKLQGLLFKIEHSDKKLTFIDTLNFKEEKLEEEYLTDDIVMYAKKHKHLLEDTKYLVDSYIELSEILVTTNTKYLSYSKLEKRVIKRAYKVTNIAQKLLSLNILDGSFLNVDVIMPLRELGIKIDKLSMELDTLTDTNRVS